MPEPAADDVRALELTPPGPGGVSVVRLTGAGALARLRELGVDPPPVGELRVARLVADGEALDEVVVLVRTEREVELHLHGSPPLVRRVLALNDGASALRPEGARTVAPGGAERPRLEDAAERQLVEAPCELAARVLLAQAEGALRRDLEGALSGTDAQLEEQAEALLARSRRVARLLRPTRVLLAGPVNAGKSTLFNALVGGERAITSDAPGTTRDLLEEPALLGDWPVVVVDGAGLRELDAEAPEARVERAGQALALRRASEVDWVLWLDPAGAAASPPPVAGARLTRLGSRADLPGGEPSGLRALQDPAGAVARVAERFQAVFDLPSEPWGPGQGVLFEPEDVDGLAQALGEGPAGLRRLAHQLLGRSGAPDVAG